MEKEENLEILLQCHSKKQTEYLFQYAFNHLDDPHNISPTLCNYFHTKENNPILTLNQLEKLLPVLVAFIRATLFHVSSFSLEHVATLETFITPFLSQLNAKMIKTITQIFIRNGDTWRSACLAKRPCGSSQLLDLHWRVDREIHKSKESSLTSVNKVKGSSIALFDLTVQDPQINDAGFLASSSVRFHAKEDTMGRVVEELDKIKRHISSFQ